MAVTSESSNPGQSEIQHAPYAARAAICFLEVEDEGDDIGLYNKLCAVLREDSRIEALEIPVQSSNAFDRPRFSIFDDETSAEDEDDDDVQILQVIFTVSTSTIQ